MRGAHTARAIHALLSRIGSARGAVDLAIGDRLALLERGDVNVLGYASTKDYVREVLGLSPRLGRELLNLARALWAAPLLRAAVQDGSLAREKAALVVKEAAKGDEAAWLAIARRETVRGLRAMLGARAPPDDPWPQLRIAMTPDEATTFLAALDMAGLVCPGGPATPRWKRLEVMCQECLGGRGAPISPRLADDVGAVVYDPAELLARRTPGRMSEAMRGIGDASGGEPVREESAGGDASGPMPAGERARDASARGDVGGAVRGEEPARAGSAHGETAATDPAEAFLCAELEEELRLWTELTALLPPPGPGVPVRSEEQLDRELRQLGPMYLGLDERVGRLCRMVQVRKTHRAAGHGSYEECCADLLGVSTRTVRSHVALERKCEAMPELREAMQRGTLTREKARMIAFAASPADVAERIVRAEPMTAIDLRRELEAEVDRKMSGGQEVRIPVPKDVMELVDETCDLLREQAGGWLPTGTCLALAALHCLRVWEPEARRNLRKLGPIRRRDGFRCTVKGCSGGPDHVHHRRPRGQGGGDDPENLISTCEPHHQRGFHRGNLRVEGTSPGGLRWWLGREAVRRSREEVPPG